MIPDTQLLQIIVERFPMIETEVDLQQPTCFLLFEQLANHLISAWEREQHDHTKAFFQLIEDLHAHCQPATRLAIENVLLYRIRTFLDTIDRRHDFLSLLPGGLKEMTTKQMIARDI